MNKKGLTLVQFAGAVIVVSIIIILLWPQYEKILDKSKYNTFVSASRQLLGNANPSFLKYNKKHFSNVVDGYPKLLIEKEGYTYIIAVNNVGEPISFKITDGTYKTEGYDDDGIKVDKIGDKYKVEYKENVQYTLLSNGTFEEKVVESDKKK